MGFIVFQVIFTELMYQFYWTFLIYTLVSIFDGWVQGNGCRDFRACLRDDVAGITARELVTHCVSFRLLMSSFTYPLPFFDDLPLIIFSPHLPTTPSPGRDGGNGRWRDFFVVFLLRVFDRCRTVISSQRFYWLNYGRVVLVNGAVTTTRRPSVSRLLVP